MWYHITTKNESEHPWQKYQIHLNLCRDSSWILNLKIKLNLMFQLKFKSSLRFELGVWSFLSFFHKPIVWTTLRPESNMASMLHRRCFMKRPFWKVSFLFLSSWSRCQNDLWIKLNRSVGAIRADKWFKLGQIARNDGRTERPRTRKQLLSVSLTLRGRYLSTHKSVTLTS